jgi:hypothetical protein
MELQKQTVNGKTLKLLLNLMSDSYLKQFALAGGTALSLQIGHRQSIDLDLFSMEEFDASEMDLYLDMNYEYKQNAMRSSSLMCNINGVKVDLVTFKHKNIDNYEVIDNIRSYSIKDITAMKMFAISLNPSRLKDYVDIAYLSKYFSLNQMLELYSLKYPNKNPLQAYKMLFNHTQIQFNEPIKLQTSKYKWENILERLNNMKKYEDTVFDTFPE